MEKQGYFGHNVLVGPGGRAAEGAPGSAPKIADAPVILPGAGIYQRLVPKSHRIWERMSRRRGEASIYNADVSPKNPVQFDLLKVDEQSDNNAVFLTGFSVTAYGFSGVGASDTVVLDRGNLTSLMAIQLTVGSNAPFNSASEIVPRLIGIQGTKDETAFLQKSASNALGTSGSQGALLPLSDQRPGAPESPFSIYLPKQSGTLEIRGYVFRPIPVPVAFFECKVSGFITSLRNAERILESIY